MSELMNSIFFSKRELDLLSSLIDYWQDHAKRCDSMQNRTMAEKQKSWDLERVHMLIKLRLLLIERMCDE